MSRVLGYTDQSPLTSRESGHTMTDSSTIVRVRATVDKSINNFFVLEAHEPPNIFRVVEVADAMRESVLADMATLARAVIDKYEFIETAPRLLVATLKTTASSHSSHGQLELSWDGIPLTLEPVRVHLSLEVCAVTVPDLTPQH